MEHNGGHLRICQGADLAWPAISYGANNVAAMPKLAQQGQGQQHAPGTHPLVESQQPHRQTTMSGDSLRTGSTAASNLSTTQNENVPLREKLRINNIVF
jgi:hypothetical protein